MNVTRLALAAVAAALALPGVADAACHADASYCADNDVVSVSVVARDGDVAVYRGGDTLFDHVVCLPERVAYALDESTTDDWYGCWQGEHRVL